MLPIGIVRVWRRTSPLKHVDAAYEVAPLTGFGRMEVVNAAPWRKRGTGVPSLRREGYQATGKWIHMYIQKDMHAFWGFVIWYKHEQAFRGHLFTQGGSRRDDFGSLLYFQGSPKCPLPCANTPTLPSPYRTPGSSLADSVKTNLDTSGSLFNHQPALGFADDREAFHTEPGKVRLVIHHL